MVAPGDVTSRQDDGIGRRDVLWQSRRLTWLRGVAAREETNRGYTEEDHSPGQVVSETAHRRMRGMGAEETGEQHGRPTRQGGTGRLTGRLVWIGGCARQYQARDRETQRDD